jgi:hypothetical protein
MTAEEEAAILALKDRRQHDPSVVSTWLRHENSLHRQRMALALGVSARSRRAASRSGSIGPGRPMRERERRSAR